MATGQQRSRRRNSNPRIKALGTFDLHGDQTRTYLTITQALSGEDFPSDVGESVVVDLIIPDDGDPFLEVHRASDT